MGGSGTGTPVELPEVDVDIPDLDITTVRKIIDISEDSELRDEVIQQAIDDAEDFIDSLSTSAPDRLIKLAKRFKAAYFAYRSYSDRVQNVPRGTVDAQGIYKPRTRIYVREVEAKLKELKTLSDEFVAQIVNYSASVIIPEITKADDSENYPDAFRMYDLPTDPGW